MKFISVEIRLRCFLGVVLALLCLPQAHTAEDAWARTLARAAESVVSLQLAQLRNFDDTSQGGSTATGFVVDAERGIVLTNRHVVGSGPVRLTATFQNQERVDAVPLYRDPIHDFAFVRYDPAKIQYAKPQSMRLRPDKVSTGLNIRVIGSDGGEQLSILTGTIARVDREVPTYGRYGYNDFNTFYLQAASSTSGGSSGSPVIDFEGDVVALNAAANTRTASSFFLPLHRIKRALHNLQNGRENTRGGLQTLFSYQPFRSLRRLGLNETYERQVRSLDASNTGMLVVSQVLPGGVSAEKFEAGDILLTINDEIVPTYLELEMLLDDAIGEVLSVEVLRQGQKETLKIKVSDLHALAPSRFIELGDTILQNMSIQHSRAMNLPPDGVVVMRAGYYMQRAGIPQSSVITELDGVAINSIDDVLEVLEKVPTKQRLLTRYIVPGREFTTELAQLVISDDWFGNRLCDRMDDVRFWDCHQFELPTADQTMQQSVPSVPGFKDPLLNRVAPALVRVDFNIPYSSDNVYARHFKGVGMVIDRELGLVAVDRDTVPVSMGDAEITFFGSHIVEAKVVFLHPVHNVALLQYDADLMANVEFDELNLVSVETPLPDTLFMVGYRADGTFRKHEIDDFSRLTITFNAPTLPRFQQSAVDVYGAPNLPPSLGGPFVDANGDVHAMLLSFAYQDGKDIVSNEWAMPAYVIKEALRLFKSGQKFHSLDARVAYRPISLARELGLPDDWLNQYMALEASKRRVIYVEQIIPGAEHKHKLAVGDVLLAIDGQLVSDLFAIETLAQKSVVRLTALRAGEVVEIVVEPSKLSASGTERIVSWGGAVFQEPHLEIARFKGLSTAGVYITDTEEGSPALWDNLYRNRFVTAVDGVPVSNLEEFLREINQKKQDEITRLSLFTMSGREGIVSVQPEYNFWPTIEIVRDGSRWRRIRHSP